MGIFTFLANAASIAQGAMLVKKPTTIKTPMPIRPASPLDVLLGQISGRNKSLSLAKPIKKTGAGGWK